MSRFLSKSKHIDSRQCTACGIDLAKINGKTLTEALKQAKWKHGYVKEWLNNWVYVCPRCHANELDIYPFLYSDKVMRTVSDVIAPSSKSEALDFCGFAFSKSALRSGISLLLREDKTTKEVESLGHSLKIESPLNFSEAVCNWGKGQRVWGNLVRRNPMNLDKILTDWFCDVSEIDDDEEAISLGIKIRGLGLSFASKHLRMLDPQKYAVLDQVLSDGLGLALNPKGYKLFMRLLREFQAKNKLCDTVASLESGVFMLVRQHVRIQNETTVDLKL